MTNIELMNLKAALEAKRLELASQLQGRVRELTIEEGPPDLIDRMQVMSAREEAAGMLSRFSSTLADVERSLRALDEDCYGECMGCHGGIPLRRLRSIPWTPYCVRCQERFETAQEGSGPDFGEPQAA